MFFIDEPYVSDFLKKTLKENQLPVAGTKSALKMGLYPGTNILSEDQVIDLAKKSQNLRIYTNSENAIGWIAENLNFTELPQKIEYFKNKAKFRELTRCMLPDFFFLETVIDKLDEIYFETLPLPFVIKPTVGFFSMGVHKVKNEAEWLETKKIICEELEQTKGLYPEEVMNSSTFIIEECIDGDEFAVDAYFDTKGEPVILDILEHTFSSDSDVSDRVYTTSKKIIEENLEEFSKFLATIGRLTGVTNFPVHVELRRRKDGLLLPIEVNPMRFGGWCSTPDLAYHAYGINPYLYFIKQQKPNWPKLLQNKLGKLFSLIVLDNSTGITEDQIQSFDYEKMLIGFENPLELRRIEYKKYPVFGFLFVETREENKAELIRILNSDLKEFVQVIS